MCPQDGLAAPAMLVAGYLICSVHLVENLMIRREFSEAQLLLMDALDVIQARKASGFDDLKGEVANA
jgi:hypothetical protein